MISRELLNTLLPNFFSLSLLTLKMTLFELKIKKKKLKDGEHVIGQVAGIFQLKNKKKQGPTYII